MHRFLAALFLALLPHGPAQAEPDFGPPDQLFDFTTYGWLTSGALFCMDGDCQDGGILYLVADTGTSTLSVHFIEPAVEPECYVMTTPMSGRLYGTPAALVYPARLPDPTLGVAFFGASFAELTPRPGSAIRFIATLWGAPFTAAQTALAERLEQRGDLSALQDPDWPATWGVMATHLAAALADLPADTRYSWLELRRVSGNEEMAAAVTMAVDRDEDGEFVRPILPADCLPADFLAGVVP